jgi:hypothetical protein
MSSEPNAPRSRRAILAAAAGSAAALAASAALPLTAAAAPANMQTESDNPTIAETSITQTAGGSVAFKARTDNADYAAVVGSTGDETAMSALTSWTGLYGYSQADPDTGAGAGVWGQSDDTGVIGTGSAGVIGFGGIGVWGAGGGAPGVIGDSDTATIPGVLARGSTSTGIALQVAGKVIFSRSNRSTIGSGKASVKVTLAGVSASSRIFAVLHSNRSGRYVRAVVPGAGYFTIYLNTTVTSSTYVAWFVLN